MYSRSDILQNLQLPECFLYLLLYRSAYHRCWQHISVCVSGFCWSVCKHPCNMQLPGASRMSDPTQSGGFPLLILVIGNNKFYLLHPLIAIVADRAFQFSSVARQGISKIRSYLDNCLLFDLKIQSSPPPSKLVRYVFAPPPLHILCTDILLQMTAAQCTEMLPPPPLFALQFFAPPPLTLPYKMTTP